MGVLVVQHSRGHERRAYVLADPAGGLRRMAGRGGLWRLIAKGRPEPRITAFEASFVIPAQAGIRAGHRDRSGYRGIPACAGMTGQEDG